MQKMEALVDRAEGGEERREWIREDPMAGTMEGAME